LLTRDFLKPRGRDALDDGFLAIVRVGWPRAMLEEQTNDLRLLCSRIHAASSTAPGVLNRQV